MKAARLLAAVLVCVGLMGQASARAESKASDPVRFSLDFMGSWTDNRDAWSDAEKEDNFDFYAKPRVDAIHHGEQAWVDFHYAPSYRYRTNPSDVQNDTELQHDLGMKIRYNATPRLELRLAEKFDYTDDPSIENDGARLRNDRTYFLNRAEVGMLHDVSRRAKVDIYVRDMLKRYTDSDVAAESDEDRMDGGVTIYGQVTPSLALSAMGRYSDHGFSSRYGLDRDFSSAYGGVGVERIFTPSLHGGVRGGMESVQYNDKGLDSQVVPSATLWAKGWTIPTTMLSLDLSHGVREADAYPFASQEYTDVRGGVEWHANAKIILNLSGVYRLSKYDSKSLPPSFVQVLAENPALADYIEQIGAQSGGDETTIEEEASLTFMLTDLSSIKVTQRYENVDSDVSVDYTRNTISLALSKQF